MQHCDPVGKPVLKRQIYDRDFSVRFTIEQAFFESDNLTGANVFQTEGRAFDSRRARQLKFLISPC